VPTLDGPALAWITLAIVAAIVEVSIPHFGVIFISLAAVVAAVSALLGLGGAAQVVTFAFVLGASLVLLRPRFVGRLGTAPGVPSRTEALVGQRGVVTADIDPIVGAGRVNVGGQDWAAHSAAPVRAGTHIQVVGADGIVLEVTPA
jgi:membrane protein implicated in regulation of membrane protease activity